MSATESQQPGGQPHLQKQDLATLVREFSIKYLSLASFFFKKLRKDTEASFCYPGLEGFY